MIKEVADVTFYQLDDNGKPMYPVLYLDTLKVSTIEQTAETADARGGKGNAKLISWDFNKEINVTLEDALFSAKSLAIMFGDGSVRDYNWSKTSNITETTPGLIMKTELFTTTGTATGTPTIETTSAESYGWSPKFTGPDGKQYDKINPKFYPADRTTDRSADTNLTKLDMGTTYFCTYDIKVSGSVIEVSANTFPGTLMDRAPLWGIKILTNQFSELLGAA